MEQKVSGTQTTFGVRLEWILRRVGGTVAIWAQRRKEAQIMEFKGAEGQLL